MKVEKRMKADRNALKNQRDSKDSLQKKYNQAVKEVEGCLEN